MAASRGYNNHSQIPLYAWISLGAFLCCFVVLVMLISNVEKLASVGLVQRLYYIVLVLMGLAAAVFLFGTLSSSATYEGKLLGGRLRLGGAIVGAALVVVGGFFFAPNAPTFPLTVYVHGQGGPQDVVLRNSGNVWLELGPEVKSAHIGESGQAYFPAIPENFQGQRVPAWVESETYELVDAKTMRQLVGSVLYLEVRRKLSHYELAGTVFDEVGNPLPGVRIMVPQFHVDQETNGDGRFELHVVATNQQIVDLIAQKHGYQTTHLSPTLGDIRLSFSLRRYR